MPTGLLSGRNVNRGERRAAPAMRPDDETMPAPKEEETDTAPMPSPGEEQDTGEDGDQPNVSPEEQAQYNRFVANGMKVIFNEKTAPAILKRIQASQNPVEGLAATTVQLVTRLRDSAAQKGTQISNDVLLHGGQELMENIAELSDKARIHTFTPDELEQAMYVAMDLYGTQEMERGTLDKEGVARDFKTMMEADKRGEIDKVLPGLSEYAKKIGGRAPREDAESEEV